MAQTKKIECPCGETVWPHGIIGDRSHCDNCGRTIKADGTVMWKGPSERLYDRLWYPARTHFIQIHSDMRRLEKKLDKLIKHRAKKGRRP